MTIIKPSVFVLIATNQYGMVTHLVQCVTMPTPDQAIQIMKECGKWMDDDEIEIQGVLKMKLPPLAIF